MFTDSEREALAPLFGHHRPFGPITSEGILTPELQELLFKTENRLYREGIARHPSVIVGRRGSGKTAFLQHLAADPAVVGIPVPVPDMMNAVASVVASFESSTQGVYEEQVARIWNAVLAVAFISRMVHPTQSPCTDPDLPERQTLTEFLRTLCPVDSEPQFAAARFCEELIAAGDQSRAVLTDPLAFETAGGRLRDCVAITETYFRSRNLRPILLLDTMEKFLNLLTVHFASLSGLLRLIGSGQRSLDVCLAFPAELFHTLGQYAATNPLKDFERTLFLHWHPAELVRIAAHRLVVYLAVQHPSRLTDVLPPGTPLEDLVGSRAPHEASRDLLARYLPRQVTNRLKVREDPLTYILRHTQMMPRQLLLVLNRVCEADSGWRNGPQPLSSAAITRGVQSVERELVNEISSSYSANYPDLGQVAPLVVGQLRNRFDESDLEQAFRRQGRKVLPPTATFDEFKRMLIEVGCIGRVREVTRRYVIGEFEHGTRGQLFIGSDQEMCLHPIFSGAYNSPTLGEERSLPVQPTGTAFDASDERSI